MYENAQQPVYSYQFIDGAYRLASETNNVANAFTHHTHQAPFHDSTTQYTNQMYNYSSYIPAYNFGIPYNSSNK
jgi:hypothetical protein